MFQFSDVKLIIYTLFMSKVDVKYSNVYQSMMGRYEAFTHHKMCCSLSQLVSGVTTLFNSCLVFIILLLL